MGMFDLKTRFEKIRRFARLVSDSAKNEQFGKQVMNNRFYDWTSNDWTTNNWTTNDWTTKTNATEQLTTEQLMTEQLSNWTTNDWTSNGMWLND